MSGMLDYVAEAIRLLRDQADAVHESHNAPGETTFEGEPEAEAAYAELERVANGLETEIAARLRGEAAPAPVAGDAVTTPATPLTLRGLIAYGRVAAMPWQRAKPDHMRDLIGQMVPHLLQLEAALEQDRAAFRQLSEQRAALLEALELIVRFKNLDDTLLTCDARHPTLGDYARAAIALAQGDAA